MPQTPTVGRALHYWPDRNERTPIDPAQPFHAVVVYVNQINPAGTVNLLVTDHYGNLHTRDDVEVLDEPTRRGVATWPKLPQVPQRVQQAQSQHRAPQIDPAAHASAVKALEHGAALAPEAITGYRKLTKVETDLINEGKALAEQCGAYIAKLRAMPATGANGIPVASAYGPSIDQRWISIGATDLQRAFMAITRGIAQPTTF